jgi:indole-3-acetate monooxygenase
VVKGLAPQIQAAVVEIEQLRRLPTSLVRAMADAGLFRLWIPRSLGGEEADPMALVRAVEEVSRIDGATGWCLAIGGEYGVFGGYLPVEAARQIYGTDPHVFTSGALRAFGKAVVVDGGYRVSGQWPLGSGCQHSTWMVGSCQILEGGEPKLGAGGAPMARLLFFPAQDCEILDTWHSIGLRGTGSHDYTVTNLFVPASHSLSFLEQPVEPGPLYALPTIALFATALAAVPLGIARHAIDILTTLAGTKIATRSMKTLSEDVVIQSDLGRAEALVRSGRAFLYEALEDAWQTAIAKQPLSVKQRAMLWLAATHAASSAKTATELMFHAGGSASAYTSCMLEKCVRDVHAAGQHLTLSSPNYAMAGQALLGADMRGTTLLSRDNRDRNIS